jgi:hypothetical protein
MATVKGAGRGGCEECLKRVCACACVLCFSALCITYTTLTDTVRDTHSDRQKHGQTHTHTHRDGDAAASLRDMEVWATLPVAAGADGIIYLPGELVMARQDAVALYDRSVCPRSHHTPRRVLKKRWTLPLSISVCAWVRLGECVQGGQDDPCGRAGDRDDAPAVVAPRACASRRRAAAH